MQPDTSVRPLRLFILTGEPSGDLHGAHLARAMRLLAPTAVIEGAGGARMRAAGVDLAAVSEHWGAMGIPDALKKVPMLLVQMARLVRYLRQHPPDVLICIDFGAFNVRLLRRLHGCGIRALYYIPPGSWSRTRAAGQLPFLVDAIATPFPWSAENLRRAGAPARIAYVGHPLREYCRPTCTRADARTRLGLDAARPVIAVLPGSRASELHYVFPAFLDAVQQCAAPQVLLAAAPSLDRDALRRRLPALLDVRILDGVEYDLIQAADAALVTSGTATLELACLDVPMVVAYRGSWAAEVQYKLMEAARITYIALPNILADAPVVPELIQHAAHPDALAAALHPLLTDTPVRRAQLDAFAAIRATLGDGATTHRVAALALEVARSDAPVALAR